jgi:UDP-glucose 4-epimerase
MKILITGGAGYIGSHAVKALGKLGHGLTIFDNLSTGHKKAITFGELVVGDLNNEKLLDELFATKKFDAVLHFAGSIVVPESVENPAMVMSKAEKIRKVLGWKPKYDDLDLIIRSAYEWEKKGLY